MSSCAGRHRVDVVLSGVRADVRLRPEVPRVAASQLTSQLSEGSIRLRRQNLCRVCLEDDAAKEASDAQPCEQAERDDQHDEDEGVGHVGQGWGECGSQTFAHINNGINQNADLEPADVGERGPRVVDAAKKCNGDNDHAKDETDLLRSYAGTDGEAEGSGDKAGKNENNN